MRIRDALVLYAAVILLALADARLHRASTTGPAAAASCAVAPTVRPSATPES